MKNKLFYVFITILLIFAFSSNVSAEAKKYTSGESYIVVDKGTEVVLDEAVQYEITKFDFQKASWNEVGSWQPEHVYLFTDIYDSAYRDDKNWWNTLYVCKSINWAVGGLWQTDEDYAVYTNSLIAEQDPDNDGFFTVIFGGESSNCLTYTIKDKVPEENLVNNCSVYENMSREIFKLSDSYAKTKNIAYKSEYRKSLEKLKGACNQALAGASWNDACVARCTGMRDDLDRWEKVFNNDSDLNACGFSGRLLAWIYNIIKWIKYILPAMVIILGILDFIKAIGADKDDETKKAQGNFVRRLIAAALVFLVPLIIQFVLEKMGFNVSCSLW